MFNVVKRGALLVPSNPQGNLSKNHLFVILNEPVGPQQEIIIVPICTVYEDRKYDDSCIVNAGDHDFIKHPSYVYYRKCRQHTAFELKRGIENRLFVDKGIVSVELFDRIISAASRSKFTPRFVNEYV